MQVPEIHRYGPSPQPSHAQIVDSHTVSEAGCYYGYGVVKFIPNAGDSETIVIPATDCLECEYSK